MKITPPMIALDIFNKLRDLYDIDHKEIKQKANIYFAKLKAGPQSNSHAAVNLSRALTDSRGMSITRLIQFVGTMQASKIEIQITVHTPGVDNKVNIDKVNVQYNISDTGDLTRIKGKED